MISPLLLNIALQGMEAVAGVRYEAPHRTHRTSPVLVRYADDFVVLCTSQEQVEQVQRDLTPWLQSRGLSLNPDKMRVVHLAQGFDFLGFHVRRYGTKLLIKRVRPLCVAIGSTCGLNSTACAGGMPPMLSG